MTRPADAERHAAGEARIMREVRAALTAYCDKLIRYAPAAIAGRPVKVHILTGWSVSNQTREAIEELAQQFVLCDLPGAVHRGVYYALQPAMDLECRVEVAPAVDRGRRRARAAGSPVRLILTYQGEESIHDLEALSVLVPVGRDVDERGTVPPVRLPSYAHALPTGELLQVQNWDGEVDWRRTARQPRYTVEVDDRVLLTNELARARPTGTLTYRDPSGRRTTLGYRLSWDGRP